jgi:hypothetical protein
MPGKLVVLVRNNVQGRWAVYAAALSVSEAQSAVDAITSQTSGARIVVANVVRSFVTSATATEDAQAVIEP